MSRHIDRLQYAAELAEGKRTLDIGGRKMPSSSHDCPFSREYAKIEGAATEYRIVDIQDAPGVDYVMDLNRRDSIEQLERIIDEYEPELILCTDTLEHLNYHFEVMNQLARSVAKYGSTVFITVPNNGNWIFNALDWNTDHCIAFFKDIADRFVRRSDLGNHDVVLQGCTQKYLWYWWIASCASFFQPFNWGFTIRPVPVPDKGRE